jgi:hypothetical protein
LEFTKIRWNPRKFDGADLPHVLSGQPTIPTAAPTLSFGQEVELREREHVAPSLRKPRGYDPPGNCAAPAAFKARNGQDLLIRTISAHVGISNKVLMTNYRPLQYGARVAAVERPPTVPCDDDHTSSHQPRRSDEIRE